MSYPDDGRSQGLRIQQHRSKLDFTHLKKKLIEIFPNATVEAMLNAALTQHIDLAALVRVRCLLSAYESILPEPLRLVV